VIFENHREPRSKGEHVSMKAPKSFNLFTQTFEPDVRGDYPGGEDYDALQASTAGITITTVSGTAVAGTRTGDTTFTRSSGVWIERVIIAGTFTPANWTDGETVTETGSSSTGVLESISATKMVLNTITKAFTGSAVLTGGTSGETATGGTATNVTTNLKGWLAWSHASGTLTAGAWVRIVSNTATVLTTDGTLHAVGTAVVLTRDKRAARNAMDISYGS
jgi:hypothetical protein